MKAFDPGLGVIIKKDPIGLDYEANVFGPVPENRTLDSIRKSLKDPECTGPDIVYSIAMDVGKKEHKEELEKRMLLFGVVTYAAGSLGREPVRSQGHIHRISDHSGWPPPEIYEIWEGEAIIYMQESAEDDPGRCFAVHAGPGDIVIVPPGWAHATISANPEVALTFGAWCDREYGFEYDDVRAHQGLAWYPVLNERSEIVWEHNDNYKYTELIEKRPEDYGYLGIRKDIPIYQQFEEDPEVFQFVSRPSLKKEYWFGFTP